MAAIKAIEANSVHQIQSGQVIIDLCSVVKELVENSLDAGATTLEVRFKNYGLDSIEVQDNGSGISPSNYANVALKHYTSKLSAFDDLSHLRTFGFRGEALSSLCALSTFSVTTALATEAPKGTKLDFDMMGKLKSTSTVASGRGTTASVENLFGPLPVRRRELTKNIKREYGKVVGLMQNYACIGVKVKFTFKNTIPKGKSMVVFSTKGNDTTRDNIANIHGVKTLSALVPLDLQLEIKPSGKQLGHAAQATDLVVKGHISKPSFGEGRQTPDRQMFFVNGRPCGLPQIAKAINEVYKSYNVSQSPFIFADLQMDTASYDVNVSPDKRTILLHDAAALIESLRQSLTNLFDNHEQTMPQSQLQAPKLPMFKQLSVQRPIVTTPDSERSDPSLGSNKRRRLTDDTSSLDDLDGDSEDNLGAAKPFANHFRNEASTREGPDHEEARKRARAQKDQSRRAEKTAALVKESLQKSKGIDEFDDLREMAALEQDENGMLSGKDEHTGAGSHTSKVVHAGTTEAQPASLQKAPIATSEAPIPSISPLKRSNDPGVVQNAFDKMRPIRLSTQLATIEVDGETSTTILGTQPPALVQQAVRTSSALKNPKTGRKDISESNNKTLTQFSQRLQRFGAGADTFTVEASEDDSQSNSGAADQTEGAEQSEDSGLDIDDDLNEPPRSQASDHSDEEATDAPVISPNGDLNDEVEERAAEDSRVTELIRAAEETTNKVNSQRATKAMKGMLSKDSTASLMMTTDVSLSMIKEQMRAISSTSRPTESTAAELDGGLDANTDEELRLSLTVSKADFARMRIVGQFNLGFILAVRPAVLGTDGHNKDELFIIDQHASDEKFNFERLQAETTVGNQRMVRPVTLDLTAVEEEVVLENPGALEKNGFLIEVDTSGDQQIGRRCTLHTLPLSKEVVFDTRDLDELIHILSESPMLGVDSAVPRPSRVRKMFAMRACRSSIMIGKTLNPKQMKNVVTNMGTIDKPWNCPHGRPTMRHLTSLDAFETWSEGEGTDMDGAERERPDNAKRWMEYLVNE